MNRKKQFGLFLSIFLLCTCSFASTKYDYEYFEKNKDEGMHYILKIQSLYDLWYNFSDSLTKISLTVYNQDCSALCDLRIEKVNKNGYIVTKLKEAEKRGLFVLLSKAYKAPKQNHFSIWNSKKNKLVLSISRMAQVLRYKIFNNAEQKKWDLVTDDLTIWLNVGVLSKEYLWEKPVLITIFNLFQKYDMPLKAIEQIVSLNELIVANPPQYPPEYEQQAVDMSILNIIVGKLLVYEKLNSTSPDTISQIKSLEPFLKKMSIDIKYRKVGKSWSLQYKSQIINKGKQFYPFKKFYISASQTQSDSKAKVKEAASKKKIANAYLKKASKYYNNKEYSRVIKTCKKVIKLLSNDTKTYKHQARAAYYDRGLGYCYLKQYKKALADFSHAIRLNQKKWGVYYNRGLVYCYFKQYRKAIVDFSYVVKLSPKNKNVYCFRGLAYFALEQYDKAIADFSYGIKLNPDNGKMYYCRGLVYLDTKQYQKALQDFSLAYGVDKYCGMGMAYSSLNQYDKAIENYSLAIDLGRYSIAQKQSQDVINSYLGIMAVCIVADKAEQFSYWLKKFDKRIPENKLSEDDLVIKLYYILVNKCVTNNLRANIEKRFYRLLKNNKNINFYWSFDSIDKWLKKSKNSLTPKQNKYIRDLTDKVNTVFDEGREINITPTSD